MLWNIWPSYHAYVNDAEFILQKEMRCWFRISIRLTEINPRFLMIVQNT